MNKTNKTDVYTKVAEMIKCYGSKSTERSVVKHSLMTKSYGAK